MRKRIFEIIEASRNGDAASMAYDIFMIVLVLLSLLPLAFRVDTPLFTGIDRVTTAVFVLDYLLRLATADYKFGLRRVSSFLRYPFSFMAIVDLLSILPSLTALNRGLKMLRLLRMMRALRVFKAFKILRYSHTFEIIVAVLKSSGRSLLAVATMALAYILLSAMVIFNVEPESFDTFFDAVYWATVSLTTVGYGDIYPVTALGRLTTMISSLFGIAIVALPSSIITAGYMNRMYKERMHETGKEPPEEETSNFSEPI